MKNFKKFMAVALSATMVIGGSVTAFAADQTTSAEGEVTYEGYVDQRAFSVTLPTAASGQFDFRIDPNGLLKGTSYAALGDGVTSDNVNENTKLYFTREADNNTTGAAGKKYDNHSLPFTIINKSSVDINVTATGEVKDATGVTLGEGDGDTEDPTLYLALVGKSSATGASEETAKVGADGKISLTSGDIAGYEANYALKYAGGAYTYELVADPDASKWTSYTIHLTGDVYGDWANDSLNDVAPSVALTWKVTDPTAASVAATTITGSYDINNNWYQLSLPEGVVLTDVSDVTNAKAEGNAVTGGIELNSGMNKVRFKRSNVKAAVGTDAFTAASTITITFTAGGTNYTATVDKD